MHERLSRLSRVGAAYVALMLAAGAQAATLGEIFPPGAATCFAVQYDGRHLDRSANQQIIAVRLSTPADPAIAGKPADLIILELDVTLRASRTRTKTTGVICFRQADETWRCNQHTCNGQPVDLRPEGADGVVLDFRRGNPGRGVDLIVQGACGAQDVERQRQLTLGRADQLFRLKRMPAAACR